VLKVTLSVSVGFEQLVKAALLPLTQFLSRMALIYALLTCHAWGIYCAVVFYRRSPLAPACRCPCYELTFDGTKYIRYMSEMLTNTLFSRRKTQNFPGRWHSPLSRFYLTGEGETPSLGLTLLGAFAPRSTPSAFRPHSAPLLQTFCGCLCS